MGSPKSCKFCDADKDDLIGWIKNDYLKVWECKICGKKWDREFIMNGNIYYEMLEHVHVIINKKEKEQFNFFQQELYDESDFNEAGLKLEYLLEKELCRVRK